MEFHKVELLPLPSGITIDPSEITISVGESVELSATVLPENAYPRGYYFSYTATNGVVSLEGNVVTGLKKGTAYVYAYTDTAKNKKNAKCTIKVLPYTGVDAVGADDEVVDVYSMEGILLMKGADANMLKELQSGIYLLKSENEVRKVVLP